MQLDKLRQKEVDNLFAAILTLKSIEECYNFFDDLCTVGEIKSLAQRLEVARMLKEEYTYNQIEADTGASTATISQGETVPPLWNRRIYHGIGTFGGAENRRTETKISRWVQSRRFFYSNGL